MEVIVIWNGRGWRQAIERCRHAGRVRPQWNRRRRLPLGFATEEDVARVGRGSRAAASRSIVLELRHDALRTELRCQRVSAGISALRAGNQSIGRHCDSRRITRRDRKRPVDDSRLIQVQIHLLNEEHVPDGGLRTVRACLIRVVRICTRQCVDCADRLTRSRQAGRIRHRGAFHDGGPIKWADGRIADERSCVLRNCKTVTVGDTVVKIKFLMLSRRAIRNEALRQAARILRIDWLALLRRREDPALDILRFESPPVAPVNPTNAVPPSPRPMLLKSTAMPFG